MPHKKAMIFAHRGLYGKNAPENSLAAFERAIDAGLGIELDVRLSRDNIPVVFHDKTLKRMCGDSRRISALTLAEIKNFRLCGTNQQIPTLEEALKLIDGKAPLLIETKLSKRFPQPHRLERIMIPVLRKYTGEYMLQSFNKYSMRFMKRKLPSVRCGILSGRMYAKPNGFDFISYKLSDLDTGKIIKLREKYPMIFGWSTDGKYNPETERLTDGIII
jgi:glycerophosphoryl diester phosphodiesterase